MPNGVANDDLPESVTHISIGALNLPILDSLFGSTEKSAGLLRLIRNTKVYRGLLADIELLQSHAH